MMKTKRDVNAKAETGKAIDWDAVRERLAAAQAESQDVDAISPETMERIWARRAAALARVPDAEEVGVQLQLVPLRLGREVYGINVLYVFDIRPVERITRVPRVPAWIAGVVNLRGRILSVIDLCRFLDLPTSDAAQTVGGQDRCLVLVETPEMELALLADSVLPLENLLATRITQSATAVRGIRAEYVLGVADCADGAPMVVLDLPAILRDKNLIVHEEIV
jgi:purine-binding chemotaxis protein CheW